ncbi:MAG: hypothetical protein OET90_10765, partial [Desulfuromonadales bacterium]|nr:hypothetical protein [Desulfuromonadales bacterium]
APPKKRFGLGKKKTAQKEKPPKKEKKPKKERAPKKERSAGGSKSKVLLLVLLLVVAGGGYFFMDDLSGLIGGDDPPKTAPPQKAKKSVNLPPKPTKAKPAKAKTAPKTKSSEVIKQTAKPATDKPKDKVTVAVPPPTSAKAATDKPEDKSKDKVTVAIPPPAAPKSAKTAKPKATAPKSVDDTSKEMTAAKPKPASVAEKSTQPAVKPLPVMASGPYQLDAGSYLLESSRKAIIKNIRRLGYEPQITPVEATLTMTRLRLGSFPENEAAEALAFARTIEPASFSVREGNRHVIYAGTYLLDSSVDNLRKRFLAEGIKAQKIPVEVTRTLSRIRFGGFNSENEAEEQASKAVAAGMSVKVVKSR